MTLTLEGSSLKLLKQKERGTVTRIDRSNSEVVQKLQSMNITIGTTITVEQRSPRFLLRVGLDQIALSDSLQEAIYVRLSR